MSSRMSTAEVTSPAPAGNRSTTGVGGSLMSSRMSTAEFTSPPAGYRSTTGGGGSSSTGRFTSPPAGFTSPVYAGDQDEFKGRIWNVQSKNIFSK